MTRFEFAEENNLFPHKCPRGLPILLPDAQLWWLPIWLEAEAAQELQRALTALEWQQQSIRLFGKSVPSPRLQGWYGEKGIAYRYSGLDQVAGGWPPCLERVRDRLVREFGVSFNSVLANMYRDQRDSMGWHSDDEKELGREPVIASVSLGATRLFQLQHKRQSFRYQMPLVHGSLLIMSGNTQHHWRHCVPKARKQTGMRINLTFRHIHTD